MNLRRLEPSDVPEGFECGHPDLDRWLTQHAHTAEGHGTRTYLLMDGDALAGYFSIAPHLVERLDLPRSLGRGSPHQVPSLLLAKLAVDRRYQGTGLGRELLVRALRVLVDVSRRGGGKLIVVDAIDEAAASFYERHDFRRVADRKLVMKASTAARALGEPWPRTSGTPDPPRER